MTTKTSSPSHLVFYKKFQCEPCRIAYENLQAILELYPELGAHITVIQKEDHPELVAKNNLELYPTVLIVDDQNQELARKVGARFLTRGWFNAALYAIHHNNISR